MKTFKHILKDMRREKGWTQAQLAEVAGTSPSAISVWEAGRAIPGQKLKDALCQALGTDEKTLFAIPAMGPIDPPAPTATPMPQQAPIQPGVRVALEINGTKITISLRELKRMLAAA